MRLISVNEVAKRLGCSEGLVYKKIHKGEIPARMLTDKKLGVLESDLDEFIAALPQVKGGLYELPTTKPAVRSALGQ